MSFAHNIPVLMYHHVTEKGGSLAVGIRQFESQIQGLAKKGYRSLSANEFTAFMQGKANLPKKSLLITFDDGYLDNWVYAHPVLEKYGFHAVLFVITGLIGQGKVRPYYGQKIELPTCPSHKEAKQLMYGSDPDTVMLRWDEIEAMQKAGTFEIHSHTHTHTRWDQLCNTKAEKVEKIYQDLERSRQCLIQNLGEASEHLCWPQGYFDDDYKDAARQAGFHCFYTTDARGQNKPGNNREHIYRFAVRNRPYAWLQQRLWLATHPYLAPIYNAWKARSDAKT